MPNTKFSSQHHREVHNKNDIDLHSIVDNIPIGIFRLSFDELGEILFANSELFRIFQLDPSENYHPIEMREQFLEVDEWEELLVKLKFNTRVTGFEVQLKDKSAASFWASINARLVGEPGSLSGWVEGTVEDISSRKAGEARNVSQMENLRQASLTLTASLDLREVLDTIAECVLDLVPGMRNCHIFLYQPDNGEKLIFGSALWGDGKRNEPFSNPRSNGLTMTVAKTGKPILVPDLRTDPLYEGTPSSWSGSIIGLPLKIGERVVGVMNVSHVQPGAFTESDIHMLRLLGDQAAIAIENARLYEAIATEESHLSLLYDIGRELTPSLNSNEILERAIGLTSKALGGSLGTAMVYLPDENKLRWQKFYLSDQHEQLEVNLPVDIDLTEGVPGWAASHRKAINVPDIVQDERFDDFPAWQAGSRSVLAAPIIHGELLMGVFCLFHHETAAFSADQMELIQAICHQVGVALSNVRRYEQVQHLVEMLEREQERLSRLVERLPVGVLLINEAYKPVLINTYGSEILFRLGLQESNSGIDRLGPYSIEELIERSDDPQPVEINLDGSKPRIYEIEIRALGGEIPHWVLMLRDVTVERHNQSRIQMQDRLATVGQLAAGIAHDFNNIMATILVYSDLLLKDLALNPTGLERLSIIQQQVQRASSLIRQILDFSRQSVMEQSTLDLLPFIKEFERLLERVLPETIRVELNFQPGSYPVHADLTRLQQVLMNLAINARDAMPEGGVLSFEISRLILQPDDVPPSPFLPPGEWIAITVGDTGVGISPEVIPHIFEPFFSTKPIGEGTGLGLAQAYGIIKQHGGYIDVQSDTDKGTKFSIYLPALPKQQIDVFPEKYASPLQGCGQTILVVEDDPTTLNAIQDLLEAQGYRVMTASNGAEAMQIFELNPGGIDLLVSDMVMPEMGGLALYNQVKEKWPQVKILFVTGHPMGTKSKSFLEEKQITWLHKPFSVPEFFSMVEELLASG